MSEFKEIPLIAKAVTIGGLFFVIAASLIGCASTSKIQKSLDENYARGYQDGKAIAAADNLDCEKDRKNLASVQAVLNDCRDRLDECLFAGKDK